MVVSVAAAASAICFIVYLRALNCEFVNWDDQEYVHNNHLIRNLNLDFLQHIFTTVPYDFYIPLTQLSLAVDYHFWNLDPFGYHLSNIVLHSVNTGLMVFIADRLLRSRLALSAIGAHQHLLYSTILFLAAMIFSIHPLRVESVVWVAERKDVLNGMFTFGSIIAYLQYAEIQKGKGDGGVAVLLYVVSFILFLCSLMAKPSSIVLPVILVVIDWYPLGRFQNVKLMRIALEKLPYVVFSVVIAVVTVVKFSGVDTFYSLDYFPPGMRVLVSGNALFEYMKLMVFPVGILPYYHLPVALPKIFIVKTIAASCVIFGCFYWGRKRQWITATMLAFIVPLVPVLPFLGNGANIALAARYTYLPSMAPSILLAVLIVVAYQKAKQRWQRAGSIAVIVTATGLLLWYAVMTQKLIDVWNNSGSMWSRVIEYQPFDRAFFYRGLYFADNGNPQAAVDDYSVCIQIATEEKLPDIYNLYAFRGEALIQAGRFAEAVQDFNYAIALFPHRLYFYHRGVALRSLGNIKDAEADFTRAGRAKGKMHWFPVNSVP